jgi:cobalt/nickel transport system permease protein
MPAPSLPAWRSPGPRSVSHLHIPDGVLPLSIWGPGLLAALIGLVWTARRLRHADRQQIAYQGALGALVLGVMAVEIPLGPFEYHLSLIGPVGVLLGPAASYQVMFVASAILALVGHGGLTVVGLNALVLGAGAAVARPLYAAAARRLAPPGAMAMATAVAQGVSGLLWFGVILLGLRTGAAPGRIGLFGGLAFPMWVAGIIVESLVAWGMARFLLKVRPDLLSGRRDAAGGTP